MNEMTEGASTTFLCSGEEEEAEEEAAEARFSEYDESRSSDEVAVGDRLPRDVQ